MAQARQWAFGQMAKILSITTEKTTKTTIDKIIAESPVSKSKKKKNYFVRDKNDKQ